MNVKTLPIRFNLTSACTLSCPMCSMDGLGFDNKYGIFSKDIRLFRLLKGLKEEEFIGEISFSGGEPTIHPLFEDIVDFIINYKISNKLRLLTNGCQSLKPWIIERFDRMNISVHSLNFDEWKFITNGSLRKYDRLLENLQTIFANKGFTINVVVLKGVNDSEESISAILQLAKNFGYKIRFLEFFPYNKNMYDKFLPIDKNFLLKYSLQVKEIPRWHDQKKDTPSIRCVAKNGVEVLLSFSPCFSNKCSNCYKWHFIQFTPDLKIKICMERGDLISLDPFFAQKSSLEELVMEARQRVKEFATVKPPLFENPFFRSDFPIKDLIS